MADIGVTVAFARTTLSQVAKQAAALGTGLQNVAPNTKGAEDNPSILYLMATADNIFKIADECEKLL